MIQIGGAQNAFGVVGSAMGHDIDVDMGIGQSLSGQIVASGTITMPSASGVYTFSLEGLNANVLTLVNAAVVGSSVNVATNSSSAIIFAVTIENSCIADLNQDGELDFLDVSAFLSAFSTMDLAADLNGEFDFLDVSAFLAAIGAGCP